MGSISPNSATFENIVSGVLAAINDNREGGRPDFISMNDASPRNVCF